MNNPSIDIARRLLAELAQMTEHASMTRSLRGGERAAAQSYNRALATLQAEGAVPDGMFEAIAIDGADYGDIGVQTRLLLSVLPDEARERRSRRDRDEGSGEGLGAVVALAPFLDSADLGQMLRERIDEARDVPDSLLTALAPFLDSHDLGELVRRRTRPRAPQAPTAPPEAAPEPPAPVAAPDLRPVSTAPTTLESLAAQLRRPELTVEERQAIATRLAELAYEQSVQG